MKKRWLAGGALLGAAVVIWLGAKPAESASMGAATAAAALVRVEPVRYTDRAVPVRVAGLLARKVEAELSFKVGGIVESVEVRVGDRVTRGQVLARLHQEEIEAQVTQARSAAEKAERDVARLEKLTASGVATVESFQDARTARDVARAALQVAEFNREHASIVAPADGRVLRRMAEPDELVAAGRGIVGFAADSAGWLVRAGLADREVARVRVGDSVTVQATTSAGELLAVVGRVAQVAEGIDPVTRTTPMEIALETAPAGARSGTVVTAVITPATVTPRPDVPASALVEGAGKTAHVFIVEPGAKVVRRLSVEVEALLEDRVWLRTALPKDATVVAVGAEYLRDGMAVEIVR